MFPHVNKIDLENSGIFHFPSESGAELREWGRERVRKREKESTDPSRADTGESRRKLVTLVFLILIHLQISCDSCALVEELI